MNEIEKFLAEVDDNIESIGNDAGLKRKSLDWLNAIVPHKYVYNFSWMGRPIIQLPQDIVAVQELIWKVKPDLVIETGIAHGGSLILTSSMLALLDYCDAVEKSSKLDPKNPKRYVLGIDIDIRTHNYEAIEVHPMRNRIKMIEGSSISADIISQVKKAAAPFKKIMVFLDSNHTHDHVLKELEAYAELTSIGSYCIVFDTVIEDIDDKYNLNKPWQIGDNPKTAVHEFLKKSKAKDTNNVAKFQIDKTIQDKLLITVAPDGFLRRVQ